MPIKNIINTAIHSVSVGIFIAVFICFPARANDIKDFLEGAGNVAEDIVHGAGDVIHDAGEVTGINKVIHKTGKELDRFYKRVDREVSKGIHKTGKEIGRAPANIGRFPKKVGKEIKRWLNRDYSTETEKCGENGVICYEIQVRNGLRGDVAAHVGGSGYLKINGGETKSLYSKTKQGQVKLSIQVNPVNCGWSSSSSTPCWYDLHNAIHQFPTEFSVDWSRTNEIMVYWDPKSLVRHLKQ